VRGIKSTPSPSGGEGWGEGRQAVRSRPSCESGRESAGTPENETENTRSSTFDLAETPCENRSQFHEFHATNRELTRQPMPQEFILIPGRTSKQGTGLCEGKEKDTYVGEITTLQINPDDMQSLGVEDGDLVRMWNDVGDVIVSCKSGKAELPPGLLFIGYGDKSSQLMHGETHGSGMPTSKCLDVFVEKHVGE